MNRKNETVRSVVLGTVRRQPLLCTALVLAVAGAVAAKPAAAAGTGPRGGPPDGPQVVPFALALGYFGLLALSGGLDSLRESLLTVFGQKMTHALRSAMCAKLDKLPAEAFGKPGIRARRFPALWVMLTRWKSCSPPASSACLRMPAACAAFWP